MVSQKSCIFEIQKATQKSLRRRSSQISTEANKLLIQYKVMKTFKTIEQAANFISSHANTGNEATLNDCLCFGMGVYAYTRECIAAGLTVSSEKRTFHHLDESELLTLLAWLQENDGYLIAA